MILIPPNATREQLFELCKIHCNNFLQANNIPIVPIYNRYTPYRGFYQPAAKPFIVVNVNNTLTPRYNPTPRNQSFPNHKTDSTAIGVLAHEVGHSVDYYLRTKGVYLVRRYKLITPLEPQVTSYDTTPLERVAEAMRLFILNPDLLRLGRPLSYDILRQHLTPTVISPWHTAYDTINNSSDKYIHWATQWAKRGNKKVQLSLF